MSDAIDAIEASLSVLRRDFNTLREERDRLQAENAALVAALRQAEEAHRRFRPPGLTHFDGCPKQTRLGGECRCGAEVIAAALAAHAARTQEGPR